jgi:uncharacterized membrane protein
MMMVLRQLPLLIFAALVLWLLGNLAADWSRLPDHIATHFAADGTPNGWSTRTGFLMPVIAILVLCGGLFFVAGLFDRIPDRLINLPNKDYWLAPQRRADTFAALRDWLRWFLLAPMAFLVFLFTRVLNANLTAEPRLEMNLLALLGPMFVAVAALLIWPYWRFGKPPAA